MVQKGDYNHPEIGIIKSSEVNGIKVNQYINKEFNKKTDEGAANAGETASRRIEGA